MYKARKHLLLANNLPSGQVGSDGQATPWSQALHPIEPHEVIDKIAGFSLSCALPDNDRVNAGVEQ